MKGVLNLRTLFTRWAKRKNRRQDRDDLDRARLELRRQVERLEKMLANQPRDPADDR